LNYEIQSQNNDVLSRNYKIKINYEIKSNNDEIRNPNEDLMS